MILEYKNIAVWKYVYVVFLSFFFHIGYYPRITIIFFFVDNFNFKILKYTCNVSLSFTSPTYVRVQN